MGFVLQLQGCLPASVLEVWVLALAQDVPPGLLERAMTRRAELAMRGVGITPSRLCGTGRVRSSPAVAVLWAMLPTLGQTLYYPGLALVVRSPLINAGRTP